MENNRKIELFNISMASAIGDECFSRILDFIEVGMTDQMVADEIEKTLKKLGGEALSFPTICVSGNHGDAPHGEPSSKVIEAGDLVTMDFGTTVDGYCGDMTRTIAMDHVTKKQEEVYQLVLRAQEEALAMIKPGIRSRSVDQRARDIISDGGYGEYFIHGTGHSVGREVHEQPYLNQSTDSMLTEGLAVTVEPGIYIPGEMGVRIEDLAIITNFGIINTVKSPKKLIII